MGSKGVSLIYCILHPDKPYVKHRLGILIPLYGCHTTFCGEGLTLDSMSHHSKFMFIRLISHLRTTGMWLLRNRGLPEKLFSQQLYGEGGGATTSAGIEGAPKGKNGQNLNWLKRNYLIINELTA